MMKNYDRYTFMGAESEELISSEGQSLVLPERMAAEKFGKEIR